MEQSKYIYEVKQAIGGSFVCCIYLRGICITVARNDKILRSEQEAIDWAEARIAKIVNHEAQAATKQKGQESV